MNYYVLALAVIAASVAVIQGKKAKGSGGVWWLICWYWIVLTLKNINDLGVLN